MEENKKPVNEGKKEFENIKKTVEAQGTISEGEAVKKAEDSEKTSKEMIKAEEKKEEVVEKEIKKEAGEKFKKEEEKAKENVREGNKPFKRESWEEKKKREEAEHLLGWAPKTKLGEDVKQGKIKNIDEILDEGKKILEDEIVSTLLKVQSDLISIGQSKGKFGGGKRRAWRQTQRKTKEGNVPTFSTMAVIGDENGHVGVGEGKSKETLPARDKAIRKAKLNIIKVKRSCSAFDCACSELHTIPFEVEGKSGSVIVKLIPAPQGTGLVVGNQLKKILKLAGIKDVYSRTYGRKRTTFNFVKACIKALEKTNMRDLKKGERK
jgi:small subunit ribosomal protein S5